MNELKNMKILAVDDEGTILEMLDASFAEKMSPTGSITCCLDPAQAIELIRTVAEPFDFLITDFNMPKHVGSEVIEAAKARNPGTFCLLASGIHSNLGAKTGADALLPKPYLVAEIEEAYRAFEERKKLAQAA